MDFKNYLDSLSLADKTITTHMRKYNKMVLDEVDFTDQEKMVDYLNIYTLSVRKTFASAMSKYLQYLHQPNDKIVVAMRETNEALNLGYINQEYKQLTDLLELLFKTQQWREYVILFLLLKKSAPNKDMIAEVVKSSTIRNESKNYIVLYPNYAIWYRHHTYMQMDKINDKQCLEALSHISYVLKEDADSIVKKITGLTPSVILETVLNHNPSTANVERISKLRGT